MSPSQTAAFRVVDAPIPRRRGVRCGREAISWTRCACLGQRTAATEEPPVYLFTFDDVGMVFQRWGTKTAPVADAW